MNNRLIGDDQKELSVALVEALNKYVFYWNLLLFFVLRNIFCEVFFCFFLNIFNLTKKTRFQTSLEKNKIFEQRRTAQQQERETIEASKRAAVIFFSVKDVTSSFVLAVIFSLFFY